MRKSFFFGASEKAMRGLVNLANHSGASVYIQPLVTGRFNVVLVRENDDAN
jgi:hypothetical protein